MSKSDRQRKSGSLKKKQERPRSITIDGVPSLDYLGSFGRSSKNQKNDTSRFGTIKTNTSNEGSNFVKICFAGPTSGKSAIIQQFLFQEFSDEVDPTVEDTYRTTVQYNNEEFDVEILDTSGNDAIAHLRQNWYKSADWIVLVYSITKRYTFELIELFHEEILQIKKKENVRVILIGNEYDMESRRVVTIQEGQDLAKKWKCPFLEVSAKTGHNIHDLFIEVVSHLKKRFARRKDQWASVSSGRNYNAVFEEGNRSRTRSPRPPIPNIPKTMNHERELANLNVRREDIYNKRADCLAQIAIMTSQKLQAVEKEDYDLAKALKLEIESQNKAVSKYNEEMSEIEKNQKQLQEVIDTEYLSLKKDQRQSIILEPNHKLQLVPIELMHASNPQAKPLTSDSSIETTIAKLKDNLDEAGKLKVQDEIIRSLNLPSVSVDPTPLTTPLGTLRLTPHPPTDSKPPPPPKHEKPPPPSMPKPPATAKPPPPTEPKFKENEPPKALDFWKKLQDKLSMPLPKAGAVKLEQPVGSSIVKLERKSSGTVKLIAKPGAYITTKSKSAIKIQAVVRGWLARKSYETRKKMNAHRSKVVKEIHATEIHYVSSLKQIVAFFMNPLKDRVDTNAMVMTMNDIKIIFSEVEVILGGNTKFLQDLDDRISKWSSHQLIGDIFLGMGPVLRIYIAYVNNYNKALQLLSDYNQTPAYISFLKAHEFTHEMLEALIIQPIQRIPRYALLLDELVKNTWKDHPDYDNLIQALQKIRLEAQMINEKKREAENLVKVYEISSKLKGDKTPHLLEAQRRFVREGPLGMMKKKKKKERYLILFNDILVIAKKNIKRGKETGKFEHIVTISLEGADIINRENDDNVVNSFEIVTPRDSYWFFANSTELKRDWLTEIKITLTKANDKRRQAEERSNRVATEKAHQAKAILSQKYLSLKMQTERRNSMSAADDGSISSVIDSYNGRSSLISKGGGDEGEVALTKRFRANATFQKMDPLDKIRMSEKAELDVNRMLDDERRQEEETNKRAEERAKQAKEILSKQYLK